MGAIKKTKQYWKEKVPKNNNKTKNPFGFPENMENKKDTWKPRWGFSRWVHKSSFSISTRFSWQPNRGKEEKT